MQDQDTLLLLAFDRHKAHRGPGHCLADGLRVSSVVLLSLYIRLHVSGRHQLHPMPQSHDRSRPIMRCCTCLHSDKTRAQALEKFQHFRPTQLPTNMPCLIDAVYLEHVLRDIQSNCDNLAHGRLPSSGLRQPHFGT